MRNHLPMRIHLRGFSLVSAIFLLVVLSALGAYMVIFAGQQQTTIQSDVMGVRAYYAARAGADWAIFRALDPDNTIAPGPPPTFAACPSGTINTMSGSLSPFTVVVGCNLSALYDEAGRSIQVYEITATACNNASCPAVSPPNGYVERRIVVTVAKCKDAAAAAPRYDCG
jgi:MSHA biogenesis protein MshP